MTLKAEWRDAERYLPSLREYEPVVAEFVHASFYAGAVAAIKLLSEGESLRALATEIEDVGQARVAALGAQLGTAQDVDADQANILDPESRQ